MTDETLTLDSSLADLPRREWIEAAEQIADEDGYVENLGRRHHAIFIEEGSTLLVTFETLQGIQALSDLGQPLGWEMLRDHGWSHLCLASNGDTWFRDSTVYGYFDRLIDDGFFDEFDQVLFYGAGPCAYAAAAFSVAAPGARVVAIQPQATLDPRITEWDDRFTDMRIVDFTNRYGFAPEMLDAAEHAYVLYDPREQLDAMHAALFTRSNVTKFRMRFMGNALQTDLLELGAWADLLLAANDGTLTDMYFAQMYRARRAYRPYLRNLLDALEADNRTSLVETLCANVTGRMRARKFAARLNAIREARIDREIDADEADATD
ncbi:Phosphoadenosine phosphosulfate reductase [Sulfitobacter noctilucicola]|uniref:Phosphoadenosine phosphosulfate reductase n=1 Tax=Sulfitobacter noctilucicola TaxID=1342301 RepID=A0A7W6M9E5_9RHOB|nr:hypothetical protein [Sulfitobacter noctilucicola]KIN64747.1 Phosphoadenosine phosphosulfate reductase [Sulfitobacter noctilucicola]MBB4174107.1 hypothetical protein [Sulfitobacter noctilucicola]